MVEAEGIPPTASVASVGPGIRYAGEWMYSYSGAISHPGSGSPPDATMNLFTTGSGLIKARFIVSTEMDSGYNYYFRIKFNELIVVDIKEGQATVAGMPWWFDFILPPFTLVETLWGANQSGHTSDCNITGRVYNV